MPEQMTTEHLIESLAAWSNKDTLLNVVTAIHNDNLALAARVKALEEVIGADVAKLKDIGVIAEPQATLPTEQENPHGLHQRYIVQKANGEPVDPNAIYFVLRLDGAGDDMLHIAACRAAARRFVERTEELRSPWMQRTAQELRALLDQLDGIVCRKPQAESPAHDETLLPTVDQWMEREGKKPGLSLTEGYVWGAGPYSLDNFELWSKLPGQPSENTHYKTYATEAAAVDALEVALHSLGLIRQEKQVAVSKLLELAAKWERCCNQCKKRAAELREALAAQ